MASDWYESWVVQHVKRLGLRAGKAAVAATDYFLDRRAVLVAQRGATAARLSLVTERCIADVPAPRFAEDRFKAVCDHLKAVIADELRAIETGQQAATASATASPETIRRLEEMGLHNWARALNVGASVPNGHGPASPVPLRLHEPAPVDGPDTSFDPDTFDPTPAPEDAE